MGPLLPLSRVYNTHNKANDPMIYVPSLQDLRFEFDEYLLEFVDCGDAPLSFEAFVAEQGLAHLLP